ncbi:acyl-CoA thioesterase [Sorangium sp. So ce406]|uniref:acyl-CoA thioesterase n=1 Tax=Sorangium sp. So ce406 TaxID=3133311 RepID=UPI003F5BD810
MKRAFSVDELKQTAPRLAVERRAVRFQDVDAAGIVFYPRVLEYFSDAYMVALKERGIDLPGLIAGGALKLPLVHAEADYLLPLRFGDTVEVEVLAPKLGDTSFTVGYRVTTAGGIAAVGQTVHVCIDGARFVPRPLPDDLRGALGITAPGGGSGAAPR